MILHSSDSWIFPSSLTGFMDNVEQGTTQGQGQGSGRRCQGYKATSALWTAMLLAEARTQVTDCPGAAKVNPEPSASWQLPEAMSDQGCHEVEVEATGHEASVRWEKCHKNVGHTSFVQPADFTMDHLPAAHRDADIYNYIKLWSKLAVRLKINYISGQRPDGYAFHNYRGTRMQITGTGKVAEITTVTDTPCPCRECRNSGSPKMEWKAIWIMSAMHVVFDDTEVVETEAELFFDQPDLKDGVRKLPGVRVVDCNVRGDWSKFECATHDLDLGRFLEAVDAQVLQLGEVIREKHLAHNFPPLAVIASHPHGCSKHITVGEWTDRKLVKNTEENYEWTEYLYTTSTCTGCSGAPVWIIGPDRDHYSYNYYSHVHSEGLKCGLNKSGAGDVEKRWDHY